MNGSNRINVYLVNALIIVSIALVAARYPHHIEYDAAIQLKAVQQWLQGSSASFNSLAIPNPANLATTLQSWIVWWPPGLPLIATILMAIGLPVGTAVKLMSLGLFLSGSLGCLALARCLRVPAVVQWLLAITLPFYWLGLSIAYTASRLTSGDGVAFAVMPWLFVYALYVTNHLDRPLSRGLLFNSWGLCLLLGSVYWLKYSAFLGAAAIIMAMSLHYLAIPNPSLPRRLGIIASWGLCFVLPFLVLTGLNQTLSGDAIAISQYANQYDSVGTPQQFHPLFLVINALGAIGLTFFQMADVISHLVYFSGLPIVNQLSPPAKQILLMAIASSLSLLSLWLLYRARHLYQRNVLLMAWCLVGMLPIVLIYLSVKVNYNFFTHDNSPRYLFSSFVFLQILIMASFYRVMVQAKPAIKVAGIALFMVFFLLPTGFSMASFVKNYIYESSESRYISSDTQTYIPTFSTTNAQRAIAAIDQVLESPDDVIVLAFPEEPGPYGAWLALSHRRVIPMIGQFTSALGNTIRTATTYQTAQTLNVILVVQSPLQFSTTQDLAKSLMQRFPQAQTWQMLPTPPEVRFRLWKATLSVSS